MDCFTSFWASAQAHAEHAPNACALINAKTAHRWTWDAMLAEAMGCAHLLCQHGVGLGDRVMVLAHNAPELVMLFLACSRLGAVYAPLNTRWSIKQYTSVLERTQPTVVIVDSAHLEVFAHLKAPLVPLDAVMGTPQRQWPSGPLPPPEAALGLMFTSGTTGHPKGVVLSARAMEANALFFVDGLGLDQTDVHYLSAPMFHVGGLCALTLPLLMCGGCSIIAPRFEPDVIVQALQDASPFPNPITCMFMVPTMWHRLLKTKAPTQTWSSMRIALVGGAPVSMKLLDAWRGVGCPLTIGYGMTESGPMCTFRHPEARAAHPMDVGRWPAEMGVRIEPDSTGCAGRVWLKGPNMMSGYDTPQGLDQSSFEDGWMRTQDVGHVTPEGTLVLAGRAQDMIITGGENVYPLEIECALESACGEIIEHVVALGLEDDVLGQRIVAAITYRAASQATELFEPGEQARQALSLLLPRFAQPKAYIVLNDMPCGPTGKIDRAQVQTRVRALLCDRAQ